LEEAIPLLIQRSASPEQQVMLNGRHINRNARNNRNKEVIVVERKRGLIAILFLVITAVIFMYVRWTRESLPIIRTAISRNDLDGAYILCKRERVTGFDWRIVGGNEYNETDRLCNIEGADPFGELNLKHDFVIAGNTYIFYITNRAEYYDNDLKETVAEYTVSGWDILYPVKHGTISGLFMSPKYILESDLIK
jgi:hypothetical protein